ncbi:sigma-70 family RNA polymerase sigma factor [Bacillus salitolerans]|uniref:RNA polymerase sigma factor n=1 Tax=Bacillus salitolerans TaxID=1437434 RepID=A0ABW4LN79_9BACI
MGVQDSELVKKSLNGHYDAYSELVRKYSNLVFAVALSKTRDSSFSEDIAQEVFVKAWRKLSLLKEGEKFSSWLITITKNVCIDMLRKNTRLQEEVLVDNIFLTEKPSQTDEIKEAVWDALHQLEDKYKIVTVMHYISGYTAKEISHLLELSQSAIESRLRRAKEKLKKELLVSMVEETFNKQRVGEKFEEDVMWRIVPRIATIEIPVSNIEQSSNWYHKVLGTKAVHQDNHQAMLHLQGGNRIGVPTLYLVQTDDKSRLSFKNSNTGVVHSIIDFFIEDLERFHAFLKQEGVKVTGLNFFPGTTKGGFGFEDPDGNLLSATNVTHTGQV